MDCLRHRVHRLVGLFAAADIRWNRVEVDRWHLLWLRWQDLRAGADRFQLVVRVEGKPLLICQLYEVALVRLLLVQVFLDAHCLDVLQLLVINLQDGESFPLHQVHQVQDLLLATFVVVLLFVLDVYRPAQLLILCRQQLILLLGVFQGLSELFDPRNLPNAAHGSLARRGDL